MTGPIQAKLQEHMKTAMKAGEKEQLLLIRMLIADLKNEQGKANRDELTPEEELEVVKRAAKVRREELENARQAGREEAERTAERELAWVEAYLPQQMSEAEVEAKVRELITELGISSRKEQGKLMKEWMARYRAVSDGKIVSQVVGRLLG